VGEHLCDLVRMLSLHYPVSSNESIAVITRTIVTHMVLIGTACNTIYQLNSHNQHTHRSSHGMPPTLCTVHTPHPQLKGECKTAPVSAVLAPASFRPLCSGDDPVHPVQRTENVNLIDTEHDCSDNVRARAVAFALSPTAPSPNLPSSGREATSRINGRPHTVGGVGRATGGRWGP
jgi:hypothetical protein